MLRCYRAVQPAMTRKLHSPPLLFATSARFYRTTPEAAASVVDLSPASVAPPQTYFDYLDRLWSTRWFGTVDEQTVATATTHAAVSDPSWFAQAFMACQHALGVDAGTLLFLVGAMTRLGTLCFSFYGERAGERMRLALPELKKPQEDFNRVYYSDFASAMEVQVAASVLKSQRRAVFRKYDTSNWKCLASLAMAPVVMTGLYQVSALCESAALDVGSSAFLWCGALTLPDPLLILPVLTCAVTLLNFELSISEEIKTGWMKNVIWAARLGCLCVIPVFASFRAGVCLYFIGMNVAGLLQPLLLRSVTFRRWFGFPSAEELASVTPASTTSPSHTPGAQGNAKKTSTLSVSDRATSLRERIVAAVNASSSSSSAATSAAAASAAPPTQDLLQASVTVQFPYLGHLLRPQVEENAELFAKARNKQSKPDFSRRGPISTSSSSSSSSASSAGSRYARGTNPLMREAPLHRHGGAEHGKTSPHAAAASSATATNSSGNGNSPAATAAAARRTPANKGSSFASSGWKSAQLSFDENDFIPNYNDKDTSSKHK